MEIQEVRMFQILTVDILLVLNLVIGKLTPGILLHTLRNMPGMSFEVQTPAFIVSNIKGSKQADFIKPICPLNNVKDAFFKNRKCMFTS